MQRDDIATWLTAIWDEQERAARAVAPLEDVIVMGGERHRQSFGHSRRTFASEDGYPRTLSDPAASAHFALHDPATTLARIAADRQILARYIACRDYPERMTDVRADTWWRALEVAVRLLALPHADRPGYNPDWRP